MTTLAALLDPSDVVLAGYLPPLEPCLRPTLVRALELAIRPRPETGFELHFGAHAARVGGAILLADRTFDRLGSGEM